VSSGRNHRSRLGALAVGYWELLAVLAAAVIGLCVQPPLAWLDARDGISILLAILVFATAVTIDPAALRRVTGMWRRLLVALAAGVTVLPALAWVVSRVVAAGSLREGVLAVGVAPCEIASVATTAMAGGEAALAAGILIGTTVVAVAAAGPILTLEAGHGAVHPGPVIANLALIVALPLAVGLVLRAVRPIGPRTEKTATVTATLTVAALVGLIAAEVHLSVRYLGVAAALLLFLAGSAVTGRLLGRGASRPAGAAILLTTSMRDFAIAAGLAAAAFGPKAAAPLGLYGIIVLIWGTAVGGALRGRSREPLPAVSSAG
jgi:predicted Na+-dependent transporter